MTIFSEARKFAFADNKRAWTELSITLLAYIATLTFAVLNWSQWLMVVPALLLLPLLMLRIYIIQHDCAHRAFFESTNLNDVVGTLLSGLSMTPYHATRYIHNQHHSHVSDLDRRETFEIYVMTLEEWQKAGFWQRFGYRFYRHPLTLIFVGPALFFLIIRRFPLVAFRTGLWDIVIHNSLVALHLMVIWILAGWIGLFVWGIGFYFTAVLGSFVSYVVHNFEEIEWGVKPDLDFATAALKGSSVLDWGWFFDVMLMNIQYHDLHHLNAKIPGYRLKEAHTHMEEQGLIKSQKIDWLHSIGCLRWKLYDKENGRMIPFPNARLPRYMGLEYWGVTS